MKSIGFRVCKLFVCLGFVICLPLQAAFAADLDVDSSSINGNNSRLEIQFLDVFMQSTEYLKYADYGTKDQLWREFA